MYFKSFCQCVLQMCTILQNKIRNGFVLKYKSQKRHFYHRLAIYMTLFHPKKYIYAQVLIKLTSDVLALIVHIALLGFLTVVGNADVVCPPR